MRSPVKSLRYTYPGAGPGATLLFAFALGVNCLDAQVTSATILGIVTDTSHAAMAGVRVEAREMGTGAVESVSTDAAGRYTIKDLPIGQYAVEASNPGFQTVVHEGLTLTVGSQRVIDFVLPLGPSQQTFTVEAQVSQVETTTSAVSDLVSETQMRELPLNGRNFQQLIALA